MGMLVARVVWFNVLMGTRAGADAWALVPRLPGCCRFPTNINLFSAMVGVGTQVLVIALCVFMLSLVGMFYPYNRGAMLSACLVLYALTAGISGACRCVAQRQPAQWHALLGADVIVCSGSAGGVVRISSSSVQASGALG